MSTRNEQITWLAQPCAADIDTGIMVNRLTVYGQWCVDDVICATKRRKL